MPIGMAKFPQKRTRQGGAQTLDVYLEAEREGRSMMKTDLSEIYRKYIACLNRQDWPQLSQFVGDDVSHNGRRLGLSGYREMLERDFRDIPDLRFNIALLMSDASHVASRLAFDCSPQGRFLGLDVDGRRVSFAENVFYEFRDGKIAEVWSVIDKVAIEAQLSGPRQGTTGTSP